MSNQIANESVLFRERVLPSIGTFGATALLLPAISLVAEPFSLALGIFLGSLSVLAIWGALIFGAPVIELTDTRLRVSKASIGREHLGKVSAISESDIFNERGPALNPAAYKVFQGSVRTAVKISIKDPKDPTPYWLVSTRRPELLAKALQS